MLRLQRGAHRYAHAAAATDNGLASEPAAMLPRRPFGM